MKRPLTLCLDSRYRFTLIVDGTVMALFLDDRFTLAANTLRLSSGGLA